MLRFFKDTGLLGNCVALLAFLSTVIIHYFWIVFFPEQDATQSLWVAVPIENFWFEKYIESKNYWLGYSYGLCIAFIVLNVLRFRNFRNRTNKKMIFGGLAGTGILAGAGCFVIGCCGSPMLIVWLNLFGLKFLPIIKPSMAIITTVMIMASLFWIIKKQS